MGKKIKKIMLIQPPVSRPCDFSAEVVRVSPFLPLGIAYLAGYLEKSNKYEIKIFDALIEGDINQGAYFNNGEMIRYGLTDEEIAQGIRDFSPDVVGVSCLFSAMEPDMANVCKVVKSIDPDIITVVGGAHISAISNTILQKYEAIDFAVIGEGEIAFSNLLKALVAEDNFSKLDGIIFRDNSKIKILPKAQYIEDLDSLPFPALHLFSMEKYFLHALAQTTYRRTPFTQIITSRGCPCKCSFCAIGKHWGGNQRIRSAKNVLDEIEGLIKNYGIQEIHFEDENLTADRKRARELFDGMIERNFSISWNVPTGMAVYSLDEELLIKMKASGCYSVALGIESGNQEVLTKLMNKPVNLKIVPSLVRKIKEAGMDARGYFIIGYPGETKGTIRETIGFAKSLELDWAYFFIASPIPSTEMYKTCIEKGYIKEGDFDPIRSMRKSIIRTPEFDPEYLEKVREEAIIDVNFRNNPNLLKYDIGKAINSFAEVLKLYPHFDFANFYLGEAYLKKQDIEKAVDSYQKTLKVNPSHKEARQRLKELGQSALR